MAKQKRQRRSLKETWEWLRSQGMKLQSDRRRRPVIIDHHAGWEREGDPATIEFFRSIFEGDDFSNLTLPRRYMNRCGFEGVSFRNTDLSQSFLCWNDFTECDFTDADLSCCDMRASVFEGCTFVRCRLVAADLRRSEFTDCTFTGADLTATRLDSETDFPTTDKLYLILDVTEEGPEPKGG